MTLEFGEHDDVVFDRAPLINVLCQVKFPPLYPLQSSASIAGFQYLMRDRYPVPAPQQGGAAVQVVNGQAVQVGQSAPVWRFHDRADHWTVGITIDSISLETTRYTDASDFAERMTEILSALYRTIRPNASTRIGLRKVNALKTGDSDGFSVAAMVRPELAGVLGSPAITPFVSAETEQTDLRDDDDTMLVIRRGLGLTEDGPAFILDMDYFTTRPYDISDRGGLVELLQYFSDGMTSFFHWALTEDYKSTLGPRPRNSDDRTTK